MQDHEFEVLKVHASIAPKSADWPKPYFAKASIEGDKPTLGNADGPIHWHHLHDCVSDLRTRTLKTLGSMAAVDADKSLSPTGKLEKKREIAETALAQLEKANSLSKARDSVEQQVARWDKELAPKPVDSVIATEIRGHVARMKEGDRLPFVASHLADAVRRYCRDLRS